MDTEAGQEEVVEVVSSSSSPPPCTLPGLPRLVTQPVELVVEEVEDTTQQAGQDPVEVRSSAINCRPSQPHTAHPGLASGVEGAEVEEEEEFTT